MAHYLSYKVNLQFHVPQYAGIVNTASLTLHRCDIKYCLFFSTLQCSVFFWVPTDHPVFRFW